MCPSIRLLQCRVGLLSQGPAGRARGTASADLQCLPVLDGNGDAILWAHLRVDDFHLDNVGAKYLKLVNSVSFLDISMYTVELPVSEHRQPEVKEAKMAEVNNLLDYDVFESG